MDFNDLTMRIIQRLALNERDEMNQEIVLMSYLLLSGNVQLKYAIVFMYVKQLCR